MDQTSSSTLSSNTLHCALELSKNSWLLAIQFADHEQPSIYSMRGGDTERLMAKLTAARDRWAKASGTVPAITLCYEVGLRRLLACAVPQGAGHRVMHRGLMIALAAHVNSARERACGEGQLA